MPHQWLLLKFVTIVLCVCTQQNTQIYEILIVYTCVRWNLIYIKSIDLCIIVHLHSCCLYTYIDLYEDSCYLWYIQIMSTGLHK